MKLAALFTGGKDSTYAIHLTKQQEYEIVCLISLKSENPDSYMFHTPAIELTELQAEAMELPILFFSTKGEKEKELVDLENAIVESRKKFEFEGLITGALFSEYQSSRIQAIADKLGLKVISPLWHKKQEVLMEELMENNFEFILVGVAGEGMNKSWLNKIIDENDLIKLKELNKKIGFNCAGEGGETESLVINCPLFKKKLVLEEFEIQEENECTARMVVRKARLENK